FHCANSGYVSCYEFAKHLMEVLDIKGEVVPVELTELNLIARRPKFSALGSNKIRMPDWRDAIHRWVNSIYLDEPCRKISHPL
ncbi:sugar nucleotide-binding protein, partial [candidate division WOR-3 bacterium]|nr:sugar nucleotide-binding protein [candidate division WOR-3 bacterium]